MTASKWVRWLCGTRGPRSGSPAMDLVKGSGLLGVIYLDVDIRMLEGSNQQPTIVTNRAIGGAPPERERLSGGGLLAHDIGKEGRGGRGNGGHFWGISGERGADRV